MIGMIAEMIEETIAEEMTAEMNVKMSVVMIAETIVEIESEKEMGICANIGSQVVLEAMKMVVVDCDGYNVWSGMVYVFVVSMIVLI